MNNEINSLLKDISKQFGEGSAMILGADTHLNIQRVSSGSLNLDMALGGGWPRGRVIEISGLPGAGKTTIATLALIEFQHQFPDSVPVFIDVEHAFDPQYAAKLGLDLNRVIISQPDTAEQAFDICEAFIRSGLIRICCIDSVASMTPEAEAEEDMSQQTIGLLPRLLSKAMRKLSGPAAKFDCTLLLINQVRDKIGAYRPTTITSGGHAVRFHTSVRVEVRSGEQIQDPSNKDNVIGHVINIKVNKNKTAQPFKNASFPLIYGKGVDKISELADITVLTGVAKQGGAWIKIADEEGNPVVRTALVEGNDTPTTTELKFNGKAKFIEHLRKDSALVDILMRTIYGEIVAFEEFRGICV